MDKHPAFVANIAGTILEHPEHETSRYFAACLHCNPSVSTVTLPLTDKKERVMDTMESLWNSLPKITDEAVTVENYSGYLDADTGIASPTAGTDKHGRKFVLIPCEAHYPEDYRQDLPEGHSMKRPEMVVIFERYRDQPGFWVVGRPNSAATCFMSKTDAPEPDVEVISAILNKRITELQTTSKMEVDKYTF